MDTFNLFDLMGIETPAPKAEKKAEAKKPAAKKEKASSSKTFTLPLEVVAPTWRETLTADDFSAEESVTADKVVEALKNKGYDEIKMWQSTLSSSGDKLVVTVNNTGYTSKVTDETFCIVSGQYKMELESSEFEGNIKLETLAARWVETYPEFKGCKMVYDATSHVAYPFPGKDQVKEMPQSFQYWFNGSVVEYTTTATSPDAIYQEIFGVEGGWYKLGEVYFPMPKAGTPLKKNSSAGSSSAKKEEVKQKFKLPFKVAFTHTPDREFTAADFDGAEEIEETLLQKKLEALFEEYTADKTEFMYFKSSNVVEARIKSAKRG